MSLKLPSIAQLLGLGAKPSPPAPSAQEVAAEVVKAIREVPPASGRTFGELAAAWLAGERLRLVEPENERRLIGHLRPLWELRAAELLHRQVKEHLASLLRKNGGPLGPTTVNKARAVGRRVVREAQANNEWTGPNPFELVKRQKQPKPKATTFSIAECRAFLPELRPDRRRLARTMLYLGARPGELLGLKKEQVDLVKRVITFCRSHERDETKTGATRELPIPDRLVPDLEAAMLESASAFVFPKLAGGQQRRDTKLARVLRTALAAAGLTVRYDYSCRRKGCGHRQSALVRQPELRCPRCSFKLWCHAVGKRARFYDLRHSAATLHREAGCDPLVIQMALGHSARNTTDEVYTHLSEQYVRSELNKLDLEGGSGNSGPPPSGPDGGGSSTEETCSMATRFAAVANPRPEAWEARALPAELPPQAFAPGFSHTPLLRVKDVHELMSEGRRRRGGPDPRQLSLSLLLLLRGGR